MLKQFLTLVFAFIAYMHVNAQSITVTSPNGGEKLYTGKTHTISWTSSDISSGFVKLEYSVDSGSTWMVIHAGVNNTGSYVWTIPTATVGSNCLLRVSDFSNTAIHDLSDAVFGIQAPYITITSPNGGESLTGCSTHEITWELGGVYDYVSLYYSLDEGVTWLHIADDYIADNSHFYNWPVPTLGSSKLKIKVNGYYDRTVEDISDATFSSSKLENSLTFSSPNGGESWSSSSSKTISWTTAGTVGNISLKYSKDGGVNWEWVKDDKGTNASNISNTGSFNWLIPANTASSNCLLQIYENSKTCNTDFSDNKFIIDNNPAITVTSPTGGEIFYAGRSYTIYWSASNLPTNYVKIEYSTDNGSTWTSISNSYYNYGNYSWKVPAIPSTQCLIKVSAAENTAIADISNAPFEIASQLITLKTPNGGENLVGCSSYNITWDQTGVDSYVSLYYTVDEGGNWIHIADDYIADNSNSYNWSVPSISTNNLRIKVAGYYDPSVKDSSDAVLTVGYGPNYLTLTSPNGGESWSSSSNQEITWTTTGTVGNISLQYSVNGGSTWSWVKNNSSVNANNIANTGSYSWLVPANTVSDKVLLQIYENSKTCVIDRSDAVFTLNNNPVINITTPNGDEKFYGGRSHTIYWSSSNLPDSYVKVEYSSDSGATWTAINSNYYNYGNIAWTIPKVFSTKYLIKVSSVTDPSVFDISNKVFTVVPQVLTLKTPNGGESLTGCSPYTITWDQEGIDSYVSLYYSIDGGGKWFHIADDYITDNSNSYSWSVPSISSNNLRIKVAAYYDGSINDSSDAVAAIEKGANYLTLTSPNGGESWSASSNQEITWTTTGTVGNISLQYSTNGGATWSWVKNNSNANANNIANTGSYTWLVPANIVSDNVLLQIYENAKTCVIDRSDAIYAINNDPVINITTPNGGEKFYGGRSHTIFWSSSNLPDSYVKVEYSADSGASWTAINSNYYNYGNLAWTIPQIYSSKYLIKVSSVSDPSIFDISNTVFTVVPQLLSLTAPNGGESIPSCGTYRITWNQEGVNGYVKIYYSSDGGNIWYHIADDYIGDNTNFYDWNIPSIASSAFKIKVTGYYDTWVKDSSDNVFTVNQGANKITLTAPNGGESWSSSSVQRISWTTGGVVGNVSIKYSKDGGSNWAWVKSTAGSNAENIANTGYIDWLVPANTVASNCLVQVYEHAKPCVIDYSDNYFSVNNDPAISVTAPNGGENLYFGESVTIYWSASNLPDNYLKLEFSTDSGSSWTSIANSYYNYGNYSWKVPAIAAQKALIKISSVADPAVFDVTNATFKILSPVVKVLTPDTGNENWLVGESKSITWSTTGLSAAALVKIEYSANKGEAWSEIKDSLANTGSYIWTIPNIATSSQSYIKISSLDYVASKDSNDFAFTITKPIVGVTVPNDGQVWYIGESKSIQWTGMATTENVKIELSIDSGRTYSSVIASTANTGQYFWAIPYTITPSAKCFIKISDVLDHTNVDSSDVAFTIAKPTVALVAPTGADSWYLGETKRISWTNTGMSSSKIKIEYSADSGSTWTFVNLITNTGYYDWTIPSSVLPSIEAYVKISDENDASIKDSNHVAFKMVKPSLRITSPDGGETLYLGQTKVITWVKDGAYSPNVSIDYSADSGSTWNPIVTSIANSQSYDWAIPSSLIPGNKYLLRIQDAVDPTIVDYSNAVFAVSKPTITVNFPNGGETLYLREAKNIQWQSAALASSRMVKIEVSADNGENWVVITSGTGNNGAYSWSPTNIPAGDQNLIKVSDVLDPTIFDLSNAPFTIASPVITVISPNGNEKWYQGEIRNIQWSSGGLPSSEKIKIEVSSDSAATWATISSNALNTGSYSWNIPLSQPTAGKYFIKVSDSADLSITDKSNSFFTIHKPTVTVTSPNGGEVFYIGASRNITWSAAGLASARKVKISLSADNGNNWSVIINETGNTGWYNWTIPAGTEPGNYLVKVTDILDATIEDVSNSAFVISKPTITVVSPNGGEKWHHEQVKTVKWTFNALPSSSSVKIEYRLGESAWVTVSSSSLNTGSYDWTVPSGITSEQVLFKVTSLTDISVSDSSNSYFSIRVPRPGDLFETAIPIASLPYTFSDTTALYSDQYTGTGNQPSGDVFYSFTVPAYTDSVSFAMNANYPALMHLLATDGTVIKSSAAGYRYNFGADGIVPGSTYYLVIEGNSTSSGNFRLSINYHIPPVDLTVQNVSASKTDIAPKDLVTVSWDLSNEGMAPSIVNWTERIYMQSASGTNRTLLKQTVFANTDTLSIAEIMMRSAQVAIPAQLNIGDQGVFVVEVIPGSGIQEGPGGAGNNLAVQVTPWNVLKMLMLELSASEITEGSAQVITAKVSRTGSLADSLIVTTSFANPDRFFFPLSVKIPAGQSAVTFSISAPDNNIIEGKLKDTLAVSAVNFQGAKGGVSLTDNDKPVLTISNMPTEGMEGTSLTFTVSTNLAPFQDLDVFLTSNNQKRFPVPTSVTIPAGSLSVNVTVLLEQDIIPEVDLAVNIVAGALNHQSAAAATQVKDDDLPSLELVLETDNISESGGPFATRATLRRTAESNELEFTANLTAGLSNTLILPSSVSLAEGEKEKTFTIGVVDNNLVDGLREVSVTAAIFVNSCGCNAPSTSSGSVSDTLSISDNDGPTLYLTASQLTLPEGYVNAGYIRITRNTSADTAISVNLASSDINEATIPSSATIPVGQSFIDVPVTTLNDGISDGNKQVYFQATATDFATGSVWVMVSDQNKPDLQISSVVLSADTVQAMSLFNYRLSVKNTGFATAPAGVLVRGYLSKDNVIDKSDSLISEDILDVPVPAGENIQLLNAIKAPDLPGDYKLLYWVNPESTLTELLVINNKSVAASLRINPDYTATAVVSLPYFYKGTPVPVTGAAVRFDGTVASNKQVEVYVITNGLRRTVMATTDDAGNFSTAFTPLVNEAGYYTAGASFPGMGATVEQDNFNILGIKVNNGQVPQFKVTLNDTLKGTLTVTNLSHKSLSNFSVIPVTLPSGAQIQFDTVAVFAGNATINLPYTIVGSALSPGTKFEVAFLKAVSDEGDIQKVDAFYFCQAPSAYITADVARLDVTASSSKGERVVEIRLVNKGMGVTGDVTVMLPEVNWLTSVTPKVLSSIASGDTVIVVLKFLALPEVPFDYPVRGNIAVTCQNGNSLNIPFSFEKVSESAGALRVVVTNQFTYYSEDAPKVKDAHVVVKNYFSGEIYAEGYTDSTGVFTAPDVPEGKHRIIVEKEKHLAYNNTVTIDPGDTTEANVFLNYQAITFNWSVVPTAVQDEYDIKLVTQFETHVPMPVVVMEMPKEMPQLSGSEVYAFNVILTNHGLITARDVAVNLPATDPEYEFITNYTPGDLLAQQSIQVPVIMRRRESTAAAGETGSPSILAVSDYLGIDAGEFSTLSGGLNCQDFAGVVYWYTCNISSGLWQKGGTLFSYSGRSCGSGPGGGGGGQPILIGSGLFSGADGFPACAICPEIYPRPGGETPEYETEQKSCVECIIKLIKVVTSCAGAKKWKCGMAVVKAVKVCSATSSAASNDDQVSVMNASLEGSLGEVFDELADNIQIASEAYRAQEGWDREYYGDMIDSDAFAYFNSLTGPYVNNLDSIRPDAQSSILEAMQGYEIQSSPIQAFFTRWNTSIHARTESVMEPNIEYPDIINWTYVVAYSDSIANANVVAVSKGFESVDDMYEQSFDSLNEILDNQSQAVCASVKVQFSQRLTMTREAFEGTLDIFNGHPTDGMDSLSVNILITDVNGVPSNGLFEIQTKSLTNLSDVIGTGKIASQQNGIVKFLFIPELGAAPMVSTNYNFGGSVRYWDPYAQAMVTLPLASVQLTVNPSPNLMLHYFMERNILGDDPFTKPQIEPSIPAELAVMVENHGYGPAVNMTISSAQPEIIENEKGLAINFNLIGSNFQGQPKQLGVTNINFGTIPALQTRIGQWYFTSSLLGKFVSYEASVVHASSFGNPDLSLVKGVKLHELTRSIKEYGTNDDGVNDFLVNDIFDTQDRPDIIYFSQGNRTAKVVPAAAGVFSAPVSAPSFTNILTVTASDTGWNYIKANDPGNRQYELVSITRGDGQVIPLNNAWLTFVTLPVNQAPVYENRFHFVDSFPALNPVTYTVVWKPRNLNVPEVVDMEGAPEQASAVQIESITVHFNKSIDPATFTYEDLTLTFQGGPDIMNSSVVVTQTDTATFTVDLSALTTGNGFYNLTVQAAGIQDIYGISGLSGRQATWSQFLTVPMVQAFQGLPQGKIASSFDTIQVLFNLAIDESTVTPERFTIWKDGVLQSGTVAIDSVRADKKLFYLSGLDDIMTVNGAYEFTVDLPNIKTVDQVSGLEPQSVVLIVDNTGPVVVSLEKSNAGGLDQQHITYVNIKFDEEVFGFNTASVQLTRNGEVIYLNIAQLSNADLKTWSAGNFGMLTYPDGEYILKVNTEAFTDGIGNSGSGSEQISWMVNRAETVTITDLAISPDLGYSNTDGVTSGQSLNVTYTLNTDVSSVAISQVDPSGETVIAHQSDVTAGVVSMPVSLVLTGGNTGIKVTATGLNGGVGIAEKSLFIDQIPLAGNWLFASNQSITRQMDTVQIEFNSKLLSNEGFLTAIQLTRNGAPVSTAGLSFGIVNDTDYYVNGLGTAGVLPGVYQLTLNLQPFSKYSSGKGGIGEASVSWTLESTNQAPVAYAGKDTVITSEGVVMLDASASSDPDSEFVTYHWVTPAGIVLNDSLSAKPSFTITSASQGKIYSFLLLVSDGELFSTDVVNVTVNISGEINYYRDADNDGFGDDNEVILSEVQPDGYVAQYGDCNDSDPEINPGALEILDQKDNDCDGKIDENLVTSILDSFGKFDLIAYPVPVQHEFKVTLEGSNNEKVTLRVFNELGVLIDEIEHVSIGETLILGEKYVKGLYIIEAVQGRLIKTIKVIKL